MIRKMSHATIFVNNQNEALEFYRDKLSFKVHTDAMVSDEFRWLTLCTNDQPDFEIILMEPKPGMLMDEETSGQLRAIMAKGVLGAGAFHTDDCRGTYAEMKAKGVEFVSEPAEDLTASKPCFETTREIGLVSLSPTKKIDSSN